MNWIASSVILFGGLTAVMVFGVPVAIAFLGVNIVGALLYLGGEPGLAQVARNGIQSVSSFALTPIPFFILMGEILFHTGIAMRSIDAISGLLSRIPGRLAVIAIVAGTIFSAISGSTIATTAMLGSLMLPMMLERGYNSRMAMGPIMGIGGVDMLIPPSALTVLLGSLAGISISGLLIAGIVPGLIMSILFVGYIIIRAIIDPSLMPDDSAPAKGSVWQRLLPVFVHVVPLILIFGIVVGAMIAGWATPTEAAALGSAATMLAAALYRKLSFEALSKALMGTVAISGAILFIIVGATTFSQVLSFSGVANGIINLIAAQNLSPIALVIGMMIVLLILGCFIDQVSMMLITLPFFMPLVAKFGIDPIWFGVLFLICMQLGLLTPPFGLLLFTMKGVAPPHIEIRDVYMAAMPYILFGILVLALIFFFPPIATWLPSIAGG